MRFQRIDELNQLMLVLAAKIAISMLERLQDAVVNSSSSADGMAKVHGCGSSDWLD